MSDATEYMDIRLAMLGEGTPSYVTSTRTDHGCSMLWITDAGAPLGCALPVKRIVGAVEAIERVWLRFQGWGEVRLVRWATLKESNGESARSARIN